MRSAGLVPFPAKLFFFLLSPLFICVILCHLARFLTKDVQWAAEEVAETMGRHLHTAQYECNQMAVASDTRLR